MAAMMIFPGVPLSTRCAAGAGIQRVLYRDTNQWFPRGPNGNPSAVSLPSSSIADVSAGRTVALAFPQYQIPTDRPFQIHGVIMSCQNNRCDAAGSVTENVFNPRMRFQFYGAHPVYGGPYNILDPTWTSLVFGAATICSTTGTGTVKGLTSTTGLQAGDRLRFINAGTNDVIAIIASVDSATQVTLTASVTTVAGTVCNKVHAVHPGSPTLTNTLSIVHNFTTPYRVTIPPANGAFFVGLMVEHASTHATWNETALTVFAAPADIVRYAVAAGAAYVSTDALWSGASLGSNIATATFPADPQNGAADLTGGGAGANWAQLNMGLIWSEL